MNLKKEAHNLFKLVFLSLFTTIVISIVGVALLAFLFCLSYYLVCGIRLVRYRETFLGILIICTTSVMIGMVVWLISRKVRLLIRAFLEGYRGRAVKTMRTDKRTTLNKEVSTNGK
jgi:hypothetical protein